MQSQINKLREELEPLRKLKDYGKLVGEEPSE
jgi:hypothetical protein